MIQRNQHFAFNGMQKDTSVLNLPSTYLCDAHNIRMTLNGENSLLTITNERGPKYTNISVNGTYLGHCLIGTYLIVFSTRVYGYNTNTQTTNTESIESPQFDIDDTTLPWNPVIDTTLPGGPVDPDDLDQINKRDYITRIDLSSGETTILYNGILGFSTQYPIETLPSYENDSIQKVYWTDGLNQPRVINIVGNITENLNSQFDFVRELQLNETVTIQKQLGSAGLFAPGVIQYAFTYYSKYGQESAIFYTSPLLYISYKERGGSPEDRIENAFKITVYNLDRNFDYLRIYSIQRTSVNGTPIVKRVQDINIKEVSNSFTSKEYHISDSYIAPTIYIGTRFQNLNPTNCSYYEEKELLGIQGMYWYGFLKKDYPNLIIKTPNGQVTWGETSTDNSILWISSARTNQGYHIRETANYPELLNIPENLSYSAGDILLDAVSFTDTGTSGDSVDPTELLYKGGETIIANTIEQKDNTLFLGNLTLTRPQIHSTLRDEVQKGMEIKQGTRSFYPMSIYNSGYIYSNQLTSFDSLDQSNSVPCNGFKRGDYYRCGIQFQYKTGKWSDSIFIKDEQVTNIPTEENNGKKVIVPTLTGTLNSSVTNTLLSMGYKKARAVVVFPSIQDRVAICQGVTCPTMYTEKNRNKTRSVYAQSSWFFRPNIGNAVTTINDDGTVAPTANGTLPYTSREVSAEGYPTWNPEKIRQVEIQGDFEDDKKFKIDRSFSTLHSPDIQFDDNLLLLDFTGTYYRNVGYVRFKTTLSDIDIQTETSTISSSGNGFQHNSFVEDGPQGILSGLFYDDYIVDDTSIDEYKPSPYENSSFKWLVYAWHRNGSLNNDTNRPTATGARSANLKKKVISNLRYTDTFYSINTAQPIGSTPQIFNSDQLNITRVDDKFYMGNVDTLLAPSASDGIYFAFEADRPESSNINTKFESNWWWKTFSKNENSSDKAGLWEWLKDGFWYYSGNGGALNVNVGDKDISVVIQKEAVRMKYKSTPHMILTTYSGMDPKADESILPIKEIVRKGDVDTSYYRSTMFGGTSDDALKANAWIPCGEPVKLGNVNGATEVQYSYGDTYYQRWDCLKTYPFTNEDQNQIVEIGSFMLETRVNIDGRYDRNRGQINNLNMSPQNFNLLNPVYSQIDNFFTYRILDEDFYTINSFPNQITWTLEKQAGADVDTWTNITLANTYDLDGSKGAITSLNSFKDVLYCFQNKAISNILFNSRVQIPTSDGVPIEISNGRKLEGVRYLENVGCDNKWTISTTSSGLYFISTTSNHFYHIGQEFRDISTIKSMASWFNDIENNKIVKTLYDDVNSDLYILTDKEALCYSEILTQFTSFMSYDKINLIESSGNYVYTMKNGKLYFMFKGNYCNFFGVNKGWDLTFISNGIDSTTMDLDKTFSTIDYRMDLFEGEEYKANDTFDYIQVSNEYQDTDVVPLSRLKINTNTKSYHHKGTNLQKKFRIWRIQIPRNKNSLDRIRNTWCKIKLGKNSKVNLKAILYDLNVQFFV